MRAPVLEMEVRAQALGAGGGGARTRGSGASSGERGEGREGGEGRRDVAGEGGGVDYLLCVLRTVSLWGSTGGEGSTVSVRMNVNSGGAGGGGGGGGEGVLRALDEERRLNMSFSGMVAMTIRGWWCWWCWWSQRACYRVAGAMGGRGRRVWLWPYLEAPREAEGSKVSPMETDRY